jgi:high-affinity nickel permease
VCDICLKETIFQVKYRVSWIKHQEAKKRREEEEAERERISYSQVIQIQSLTEFFAQFIKKYHFQFLGSVFSAKVDIATNCS